MKIDTLFSNMLSLFILYLLIFSSENTEAFKVITAKTDSLEPSNNPQENKDICLVQSPLLFTFPAATFEYPTCRTFSVNNAVFRFDPRFENIYGKQTRTINEQIKKNILKIIHIELPKKFPSSFIEKGFTSIAFNVYTKDNVGMDIRNFSNAAKTVDVRHEIQLFIDNATSHQELVGILTNEAYHVLAREMNLKKMGESFSTIHNLSPNVQKLLSHPFLTKTGKIDQEKYAQYKAAIVEADKRIKLIPKLLYNTKLNSEERTLRAKLLQKANSYHPSVHYTAYPKDQRDGNISLLRMMSPDAKVLDERTSIDGNTIYMKYTLASPNSSPENKLHALHKDWENIQDRMSAPVYAHEKETKLFVEKGSDLSMLLSSELLEIIAPEHQEYMEKYSAPSSMKAKPRVHN